MTDERSESGSGPETGFPGHRSGGHPPDPLDELLSKAFAREMSETADVDISAQVMLRIRRRLRIRAVTLGLASFVGLCSAIVLALPGIPVLFDLLATLGSLAPTTAAIPLLVIAALAPWLLWAVDDRI